MAVWNVCGKLMGVNKVRVKQSIALKKMDVKKMGVGLSILEALERQ